MMTVRLIANVKVLGEQQTINLRGVFLHCIDLLASTKVQAGNNGPVGYY